ncbi:Laminin subunit alpha-5 [Chelonia mydas]|uniref:Laminin subunit alpha-5 n=1 Tax=Chelonia mydas TaxID=8469 RepID=M7BMB7_CHEMY|nr:Laminin subunit alpha-5 [Chelonia mydas]
MQSQNRKRVPAWSEWETQDLTVVWGEESVQAELRSSRRNADIYAKLMQGMVERGYTRDAQQYLPKDEGGKWSLRGQFCDYCNAADPNKAHPITNAIDGTERWWQSPPLSLGLQYNEVNVTLDLGQLGGQRMVAAGWEPSSEGSNTTSNGAEVKAAWYDIATHTTALLLPAGQKGGHTIPYHAIFISALLLTVPLPSELGSQPAATALQPPSSEGSAEVRMAILQPSYFSQISQSMTRFSGS